MIANAGFNLVFQVYPTPNESGNFSELYLKGRGVFFVGLKCAIAPTLHDI